MHIDIDYDPARAAENKNRLDAAFNISMTDRPPVIWGACPRMMINRRHSKFCYMFNDPVDQIVEIILNWKWIAENLPGDMITEPSITIQPQFENASNSNAHGCGVLWSQEEPPQCLPAIHTIKELEHYNPPHLEKTLWGRMWDFYCAMRNYLDEGDLQVTMRGVPVKVDLQLHVGGETPFLIATDLCGANIYSWMYEAPEAVHRLLNIITDRFIFTERRMREVCGFPAKGRIFLSDDTAQIISLEDFREFVVPYTGRIYDELAGEKTNRVMHLCGRHTHLYPALLDDLNIAGLWGYGYANDPAEVKEGLGGRMWLLGNLDPSLLHNGPVEEIVKATEHLLEQLLPYGGMIVGDGYNLIPTTPIENLQTVVDVVNAVCGVPAGV